MQLDNLSSYHDDKIIDKVKFFYVSPPNASEDVK